MATVYHELSPEQAVFQSTLFPQIVKNGTNFPIMGLSFDGGGLAEAAYWRFPALNYASSVNITVTVEWYCTPTTNDVYFTAAIAAVTPNSDAASVEAKALNTAGTVTDTAMGTAKELANCAITITGAGLDGVVAGDDVWLKLVRDSNNAADTMTSDAIVTSVRVSYSDT